MTGKTLKELNAQAGDVVKYVPLGGVTKITHVKNGKYYGTGYSSDRPYCSDPDFVIISRAKKYTTWRFTPAPENAETHTMPDGAVTWRAEVKPVVEEVTEMLLWGNIDCYVFSFNTIDGVPDCASVKMELLP